MAEIRMYSQPRVYGHGISDTTPGREERPYPYRGRDTEPDPREIAAKVRAEVVRRLEAGEEFVALPSGRRRVQVPVTDPVTGRTTIRRRVPGEAAGRG